MADTVADTAERLATQGRTRRSQASVEGREFVAMVAACMAMAALSIDVMLPAFSEMREEFGLASDSTAVSWVITAFFLGLAVGQLVYGPLSDRFGRKRLLYAGMVVYTASAVASAFMPTLAGLIVCRVAWGAGAAAPRSLALAMVRDAHGGERMARTMSMVMATFVLVPVFAPGLGSLAMEVAPWRIVFWIPVVAVLALMVWFVRLPETLPVERRRSVSPAALREAFQAVIRTRQTVAFGLVVTCLFGVMTSFIGSFEIIVDDVYDQADSFAILFGLLACTLGVGSVLSARLVMRIGLHRLVRAVICYVVGVAATLTVVATLADGEPPLWLFLVLLAGLLPGISMLMPNANTAAMTPLPHVAGMAAAVLGTVSTAGGALLGSVIDSAFDGSVRPFAYGAVVLTGLAAAAIFVVAGRPQPSAS